MRFDEPATLHTCQGQHALTLRVARGSWSRFRGLMLTRPLQQNPTTQALLLLHCPSVHGFFMRHALDVVYLGRVPAGSDPGESAQRYRVTHTARLKPWRVSVGRRWLPTARPGEAKRKAIRSRHALEMPAGSIEAFGIAPGDELELRA